MDPSNGHRGPDDDRRRRERDSERHRDRDRDRDSRKEKRRSRSRSRDRKRSSRSKSRSRSPPPRPAGRRRKTLFDVLPPGMAAGAAPPAAPGLGLPGLPGFASPVAAASVVAAPVAPAVMPVIAPIPTGFAPGPPGVPGAAAFVQPPSQQATRHARRVYVGGLPPTATESSIASFFSNALAAVGGNSAGPGNAVVNVYINREKNFAFVEFRTVEETSNAMALDGIMFEGVSVRVRRPNDYNPAAASSLGPSVPSPGLNLSAIGLSAGGANVTDAHERVFVGGLPYYLTDEQCRELLGSFGPIKSFDLVKDRETGQSKGYGFVVYADGTVTDVACQGLNGIKMGDRTLTVRRATEATPKEMAAGGLMPPLGGATTLSAATRIMILSEAVTVDELRDDEEFAEILEDMRDECSKYGPVVQVIIPRPADPPPRGLGKVVVEFTDVNNAVKACAALNGRRFAGRTVAASYLTEEQYMTHDFDSS